MKNPPHAAALREQLHEWFGQLLIQCEIAQRYCEIGDDAGLEYSTRKALAYMRVIAPTVRELIPELTAKESGPLVEDEEES